MKVTIANNNLGIWCRVIHGLAQVGDDEIHFDGSDGILTVSTVNASISNSATVLFFRDFFTNCQMNADNDNSERITIPSKTILKPYRTLKVSKSYLSSEITFNPREDFVSVTSEGKTHVSTTYKLGASESVNDIQVECDPHSFKSYLKVDAKVMSSCLSNFNHMKGLAELTLKIQGQKVMLKNSVTDVSRKDGTVVTEYSLTSHDFTDFEVQVDEVELTFGFREFKIFTIFAEQLKLPMTIHFETPNEPVIVTVKTDIFDARLCMATRIRDPFDMSGVGRTQSSAGSNGRISNVTSQTSGTPRRNILPSAPIEANRRKEHRDTSNAQSLNAEQSRSRSEQPPVKRPRPRPTEAQAVPPPPSVDLANATVALDENPVNPIPLAIEPLVDQMERRAKSVGYRSLQAFFNAPRITEEEYLKSQPGHDQILCPASDEEDANDA